MTTLTRPEIEIPTIETFDHSKVVVPIAGKPKNKDFLSVDQLDSADIRYYLDEAAAADRLVNTPGQFGIDLLRGAVIAPVMFQPSTRTGGSIETAMGKLGGSGSKTSGGEGSSEAKGESRMDSFLAFAAQSDVLGIRTAEEHGPHFAAYAITKAVENGKLSKKRPVINLGDGWNEHPTQAMGDLYTIQKFFAQQNRGLEGLNIAMVGDHERYRAFHSLAKAAVTMGMTITAVESPAAPVPEQAVEEFGDSLKRTTYMDVAMQEADVLYMGRRPSEYNGTNDEENLRTKILTESYDNWVVDSDRIKYMQRRSMILHPRPRLAELDPSVDANPRAMDVPQMENMIPMRMAIIANTFGLSIAQYERDRTA